MEFKVGDSFNSFKELEEKIEAYENEMFISLYKRDCRTIAGAQKRGIKKKLKDELIYYCIHYACYHGGRLFKSLSKGKRPNQSTYKMDCPFGLWFKASDNGDQLLLIKIVQEHNHIINKMIFEQLPKKRRLNEDEEKEASRLLDIHSNKWLIKEHLFKATGKRVTLKDLHNIAARQKKSVDLESLLAVCSGCNGPDLELKTDDKGFVTGMFYQDSEMKQLFELYPELLIIDATYQLTHLGMTLYILLAIGPNGENEIVAVFLTASDDLTMLSNMLEIFKSKNKNWDKIITIFTDKVMAERDIIQQAFPQVELLLCIFHIIRSLKREITAYKLNITEEQRLSALKALQKMLYSNSKKEYEQLHDSFLNTMPENVVQYIEENWHKCRREWVQCWQPHNVTYDEVTTNRLEAVNRRIKSIVSLLSPLPVCFSNLLSVINCMRQERTHAYINTTERLPVCAIELPLPECQFREALTPFAFSFVKRQIELSKTVETRLKNGNLISYISGKTEKLDENSCVCLFFKSVNLPCKHMFAARITNQTSTYSLVGIAARWLKQQVQENHTVFKIINEQNSHIEVSGVEEKPLLNTEKFSDVSCTINQQDSHVEVAGVEDRQSSNTEKVSDVSSILQHLAELTAKGERSQCQNRLKVLQDLAQIWDSNQEAIITPVECSSNVIAEVIVIADNLTAIDSNFTAVEENRTDIVDSKTFMFQENIKQDADCQSRQIKIHLCSNDKDTSVLSINEQNLPQAATIVKETNQLDNSKLHFPPKRASRGRPKKKT